MSAKSGSGAKQKARGRPRGSGKRASGLGDAPREGRGKRRETDGAAGDSGERSRLEGGGANASVGGQAEERLEKVMEEHLATVEENSKLRGHVDRLMCSEVLHKKMI